MLDRFFFLFSCALVMAAGTSSCAVRADGLADNKASSVRPMPPPGIMIAAEQRAELEKELAALKERIKELQAAQPNKSNPQLVATIQKYLPDVEIFSRAVDLALNEDGFFEPKDVDRAKELLKEGMKRAEELSKGSALWRFNPTPTVRGFRSKIDGTVQPYGVVLDQAITSQFLGGNGADKIRADIWCRGRAEKGLELQFLSSRLSSTDPAPAPGTMMIHPFGRYCNANKLAGEVDTLEALEHALSEYPIDPKRVAIRGFSMGGAAAWHLAVHYPDRWFAANPGAGFSETPLFLKVFQSEDLKPAWYEQKLWQMYDCPVWVRNLRNVPTVAYSGEIDKQKQAADVMAQASWSLPEAERFELTHIVAPNTAHQVEPKARMEVERRLAIIDSLRNTSSSTPAEVWFTTTTLKYNQCRWIRINSLQEHWVPAELSGQIFRRNDGAKSIYVKVSNITDFSVNLEASEVPPTQSEIYINVSSGKSSKDFIVQLRSDRSFAARIRISGDSIELVSPIEPAPDTLVKKHDLQGPIDDAFMAPFIFVKPSGKGNHEAINAWVDSEMNHAAREWHRQMRGDVTIKTSEELKPEDIQNKHLILWGDSKSNPTIAKIAEKLPIQWTADQVIVSEQKFDAKTHAPVLIYPNPLNQNRYVVLNSGFTYREYDYLNNARQVPKLPDWAVIDITTTPDSKWPGKIVEANFFGEKWELKK